MVSGQRSINLFDTKASLTPGWQLVEQYLRIARQYMLWSVLIVGIVLVVLYGAIRFRSNQLEIEQKRLSQTIQHQNVKEGMLLALRARITSLNNILNTQFSVAPYIDTTLLLARPPKLTSFSIGDKNTVQISVNLSDIGEAVSMMEEIVKLVDENKIRTPNLTSLTLDKNGDIMMGLSYSVILKQAL